LHVLKKGLFFLQHLLPNDFKKEDKDPDYNLWLVPRDRNGEKNGEAREGEAKDEEEDVPF
jgi:hypothetical protein